MSFNSYLPQDLSRTDLHQLIIGSISPRPIALVSSIDQNASTNLAPYSFFNAISSEPPMLVFSVNVPHGDSQKKDTLRNLEQVRECVVNLVNYKMHRQMTLCSVNFEHGISEFHKSGLTPIGSHTIRPPRVLESPVQFECTVKDILALGKRKGASNLIICKIEKMHIQKDIIQKNKLRIDPQALDVMGRLGRSNYIRVKGENIIEVYQSTKIDLIGYDGLPLGIRNSSILTGNEIAQLASCHSIPNKNEVLQYKKTIKDEAVSLLYYHKVSSGLLGENKKEEALKCAMIPEYLNIV